MTEPNATSPGNPPASPGTPPPPKRRQVLLEPSTWTVFLLIIFGGALLIAIMADAPALGRLSDPAYARGAITWIISLATIGIAFVLIYQAFFSTEDSDNRFRRGREIFTGLMGVLGTIVGFYFGSTDQVGVRPVIAEVRFTDDHVVTFVSGGLAPYRYSLTYGDTELTDKVSTDGWIDEPLTGSPKPGTEVTISVKDSRNQEESKTGVVPEPETASPAAPTEPGPDGLTTGETPLTTS